MDRRQGASGVLVPVEACCRRKSAGGPILSVFIPFPFQFQSFKMALEFFQRICAVVRPIDCFEKRSRRRRQGQSSLLTLATSANLVRNFDTANRMGRQNFGWPTLKRRQKQTHKFKIKCLRRVKAATSSLDSRFLSLELSQMVQIRCLLWQPD